MICPHCGGCVDDMCPGDCGRDLLCEGWFSHCNRCPYSASVAGRRIPCRLVHGHDGACEPVTTEGND